MPARKSNLWPFSKRGSVAPKSVRRSSMTVGQAVASAFKAGQQSGDTGLFEAWLTSKGLTGRGNVLQSRLRKEYERGVIRGETPSRKSADDKNREFLSRVSAPKAAMYKGRQIVPRGESWVIPSIDRESEFDTLQDAKRFVDSWKRNPVTDRAHRYRANNLMPDGPKVCAWCGSRRNVVPDHIDGFPDHTTPGNLQWLCKSCNTKKGAAFKRLGKGRLTKQYNPAQGVPTFEQYAWAVSSGEREVYPGGSTRHAKGVHDEAGAIIHATPKRLRSEYSRRIAGVKRERGTDSRGGGDMPDWVTNPASRYDVTLEDLFGKRYEVETWSESAQHAKDAALRDMPSSFKAIGVRAIHKSANTGTATPREACAVCGSSEVFKGTRTCAKCGATGRQRTAGTRRNPITQFAVKVDGQFVTGWSQNRQAMDGWAKTLTRRGYSAVLVERQHSFLPKRNPSSSAASLYESFHGKPATQELEITEEVHEHEHLAVLGRLVECWIETPTGLLAQIEFDQDEGEPVMLCSSEDGKQLYIEGGDQAVDLAALKMDTDEWKKDRMVLGQFAAPAGKRTWNLTYHTRKDFDKLEPIDYQHDLGEETGIRPFLEFDARNKHLYISGGQYFIEQPLLETSPGIEN